MELTLHDWMKREGLTDAALADRIGRAVSRSQINRIRRGGRTKPDVARELERLTKIPAVVFLMGEAA